MKVKAVSLSMCLLYLLCLLLLLSGCEADRSISLYERQAELQAANGEADILSLAEIGRDSMPEQEFLNMLLEQPMNDENADFLSGWSRQTALVQQQPADREIQRALAYPLLSKLWNFNYTTTRKDKFMEIQGLSSDLLQCLNSTSNSRMDEYSNSHLMLVLKDMVYWDEWAVQYINTSGQEMRRIKIDVLAHCDGDPMFFARHPNFTYGDNFCISYLYLTPDDDHIWRIQAVMLNSWTTNGIGIEWYTVRGHSEDLSQIVGQFPFEMLDAYTFKGSFQDPPRATQKRIAAVVDLFCKVFYGKDSTEKTGMLEELQPVVSKELYDDLRSSPHIAEQLKAAADGSVHYAAGYHSTLIERGALWTAIYLYEKNDTSYYVFGETIPIDVKSSSDNSTFGYEAGLWEYEMFFIMDVGGSQPIIIDYLLVPVEPRQPEDLAGNG